MKDAYIGVGSNLGDKRRHCIEALERMGQIPGCKLRGSSDWYLTKPVGVEGHDWYVNGVVSLATGLSARQLLKQLQGIEESMGRTRKERWEPRVIDLDILTFGQEIVFEEDLQVPHPLMHLRKFVLVPMAQLAPDLIHPSLGATMAALLRRLPADEQEVVPMKEQ